MEMGHALKRLLWRCSLEGISGQMLWSYYPLTSPNMLLPFPLFPSTSRSLFRFPQSSPTFSLAATSTRLPLVLFPYLRYVFRLLGREGGSSSRAMRVEAASEGARRKPRASNSKKTKNTKSQRQQEAQNHKKPKATKSQKPPQSKSHQKARGDQKPKELVEKITTAGPSDDMCMCR